MRVNGGADFLRLCCRLPSPYQARPYYLQLCMLPSTLLLISSAFPAATLTEPTFILPELKALARRFKRVVVLPMLSLEGKERIDLQKEVGLENVEVSTALSDYWLWRYKWLRVTLLPHPALLRALFTGKVEEITYAASALAVSLGLKSLGFDPKDTVVYSYWFESQGVGAAMSGFPTIIRAHGHDVWTERGNRLRGLALRLARKLFVVSEAGAEYIRGNHPESSDKVVVSRLGSHKFYERRLAETHKVADHRLTFLTCARTSPEKRVDMIYRFVKAMAVARPNSLVKWIYIGDGPLMEQLRATLEREPGPSNFTVELTGGLENREVQKRYLAEPVDWTILLSTTEGLPISLCESLSYGVPVIATEVGGIPELIDDSCGVLLPENPEKEEFVRGLLPYVDSDYRYGELRKGAFTRWMETADAKRLSEEFAEGLESLDWQSQS